jgi:hypothetical protein
MIYEKVYKFANKKQDMAMHFIKKIWLKQFDAKVHSQFTRFSRGVFENRAVINTTKNKNIKVSGTFELANDFVLFAASLAKNFSVSGILFARDNPEALLNSIGLKPEIKKKKNIFEAGIDGKLAAEQISRMGEVAYFMLFSMQSEGIDLKMKKKMPRPSKSGKEKVDDKFCILNLDAKFFPQLKEEFLFGLPPDFKKARISHMYTIKEVTLPQGEKDFELMRLNAKKKGKILRKIEVDGKVLQEERDFEA